MPPKSSEMYLHAQCVASGITSHGAACLHSPSTQLGCVLRAGHETLEAAIASLLLYRLCSYVCSQ